MFLSSWFQALRTGRARLRVDSPHRTRLRLEELEERAVPYATSGSAWAHPERVTLSFVPDGTLLGYDGGGNALISNLQATFTTRFGGSTGWQNGILKAAQVWAQYTNLNFSLVTDDGADTGSGPDQQGDP